MASQPATEETLRAGQIVYTPAGVLGWFQDCAFYLCNNHVFLAVFLA